MGADRFIITGLPRSRSSWLANLFTYGPCFCLHDGLRHGTALESILARVHELDPAIKHLGISDSGIVLSAPKMLADPKTKVIVVDRRREDAERSFMDYFSRSPYPDIGRPTAAHTRLVFDRLASKLDSLLRAIPYERLRRVGFSDLNTPDAVKELWNFIVPEEEFFWPRWELLDKLRVNPASEKVRL